MLFFDYGLAFVLAALSVVDAAPVNKAPVGIQVVPNGYIVVMKARTSPERFERHRKWVGNMRKNRKGIKAPKALRSFQFNSGWKGYSGVFDSETLIQIANDEDVDYIEEDGIVTANALITQTGAPWGLARVSSRTPGAKNYVYDSTAGQGVTAYIIDTGIETSHRDFGGRAKWGTNTVDSQNTDCHGHGTHVAGTVAGTTYGVAKKANLIAVKVLNCQGSGSNSVVIQGMQWALNHATQNGITKKAVVNMSLGGGYSQATNQAAAAIVKAGIFLAVAAGNDAADASKYSPASEVTACTIGASNSSDLIASFSNRGKLVDVFAPGVDIQSTYVGGGTKSMSGTSMASPHAAGLGAYLIGLEGISGNAVCERMKALSSAVVRGVPSGTTNKLIYNGVK
ncbi:uncharacterized protein PADG_07910 [Paracoccidioides brasiliensis Pb18]|uniref:Uncharacterized protein n=1 Tax=Paracoccidioides brasiliensis (strain Pb18) TaxID=502780 RepID=C1GKQ3_PARBD|nr:uncharacterized protein PADG_07910 [Paracoccidioides brasiliensis Pb18]EEH43090.1 hypothetical protein PADG_07910 [Paracoccidioides brasiliensis Pb18]